MTLIINARSEIMTLADQLRFSMEEDDTDANRRKWAHRIIEEQIDLRHFLELLETDRFTTLRFLWLTGGIVENNPAIVAPHVPHFFAKRKEVAVPNYNTSLAKMLWLAGIPESIAGEAIDELFHWSRDPKTNTSGKCFAVLALYKCCQQHPELKNELRLVIEDQLGKNGVSFDQRMGKILSELKM